MKKSIGTSAFLGAMCLAVVPIAPAYAANWVYVTTSRSNAVYYYDSDTIRRSGNQVTVWESMTGPAIRLLSSVRQKLGTDMIVRRERTPFLKSLTIFPTEK